MVISASRSQQFLKLKNDKYVKVHTWKALLSDKAVRAFQEPRRQGHFGIDLGNSSYPPVLAKSRRPQTLNCPSPAEDLGPSDPGASLMLRAWRF